MQLAWQGVIVYFRVVDGELKPGDVVKLMNTKKEYEVDEVGVLAPHPVPVTPLCLDMPLRVFGCSHFRHSRSLQALHGRHAPSALQRLCQGKIKGQ